MIAITTIEHELRIQATVRLPCAEAGQWSAERIAKMVQIVDDYVRAAEEVDAAMRYGYTSHANTDCPD